ncbi:MAG: hypothetical protein SNG14_00915 [Rikenellaceae bacterium]
MRRHYSKRGATKGCTTKGGTTKGCTAKRCTTKGCTAKRCLATLLALAVGVTAATAQPTAESSREAKIEALIEMGMEEVRMVEDEGTTYLSFEDNIYRSNAYGIDQVTKRLRAIDSTRVIKMLIVDEGVERLSVSVPTSAKSAEVSYDTRELSQRLRGERFERVGNPSLGKIDLMLYPELFLENSWYSKLYGVAVSISPAVEWRLWRGATLTGQVVIPIYTNMNDEKQYIRPGVVALRQRVKLYRQLVAEFSAGNFMDDCWGGDLKVGYYTADGRWGVGGGLGYTGSSTFYGQEWVIGPLDHTTWSTWVSYYEPYYGMEIKGEVLQMIYGDRGVRGELCRHFGEVAIGLYGCYTGGYMNGGFAFTVTLPSKSRPKRNKGARVTYPENFSFVYSARNGGKGLYGYSYRTRPDAGSMDGYFNPIYINKELDKFR